MKIQKILKSIRNSFRNIYDWTVKWADSENALVALFVLAVAESAFFPVPVDVLMIPICIADNKKSFYFAFITLSGSVLGAYLGYLIGYAFYESLGQFIFNLFSLNDFVDSVVSMYHNNAFWTIFTAGFTPIPFKVFTIVAGISKVNLLTLTIASILGRGGRFFLVAGLLRVFGDEIKEYIEKYFDLFSILFLVLIGFGIVLMHYS